MATHHPPPRVAAGGVAMHVMVPGAMNSYYSLNQNTPAPAAVLNMPPSTRPRIAGSTAPPAHRGRGGPHYPLHPTPWGVQPNMPPSTRPRIAGVHRASCPSRAGGTTFSSPPRQGCPTQHAAINKTPHSGVHRASCPSRAGGTTLSSPPHSVGCLTQHASNKTPLCGCPPRLLPIAGGGTTFSLNTPSSGRDRLHQQDPA